MGSTLYEKDGLWVEMCGESYAKCEAEIESLLKTSSHMHGEHPCTTGHCESGKVKVASGWWGHLCGWGTFMIGR